MRQQKQMKKKLIERREMGKISGVPKAKENSVSKSRGCQILVRGGGGRERKMGPVCGNMEEIVHRTKGCWGR